MTRYLLGELSEPERAALEEKYFADPQLFDQVVKTENELADKFARGKLSPQTRERFEQSYLTHPKRRERVKFAEALATRLDQNEVAGNVATEPVWTVSGWRRLIMALQGRRPILGFSLALASLLLIIGGVWFFIESRRSRQELAQSQAAQADHARRERELQQQLTDERMRAYELAERQAPQSKLTPPVRLAPTFVSLLLTVGEVRSTDTGPPATLVIPPRTEEVRLQLNLKEHDYPSYRAVLQAGTSSVTGM